MHRMAALSPTHAAVGQKGTVLPTIGHFQLASPTPRPLISMLCNTSQRPEGQDLKSLGRKANVGSTPTPGSKARQPGGGRIAFGAFHSGASESGRGAVPRAARGQA